MDSLRLRGPPRPPHPSHQPDTEAIKRNLLENGVTPTPKMVHTLRKKKIQKYNRRRSPTDQSQKKAIVKATKSKQDVDADNIVISSSLVGKPWERLERAELMEYASGNNEFVGGDNLKYEHLEELSEFIEKERDKFKWILEDDLELEDGLLEKKSDGWVPPKRKVSDAEAIRILVDRLSGTEPSMKNWKFSKMMKQSGLQFTEDQLLKIVGGLGDKGQWRHALSVVKWVYNSKEHRHFKSRFVYTKLLAVLGKARRSHEALQIFNSMRADLHTYPDMAAYHCIAIALGQSGLLKELVNVIDCMKQEPSNIIKKMRHKNWDPVLMPDLVVYNAVLNACTLSGEWKGVSWVFEELRRNGLKPNGATYGLAMELRRNDMFFEAKELFEDTKRSNGHNISLGRDGPFVSPDAYTYGEMLRVSASAHQWEYFDYVYKEMVFSGYQLDQNKHAFLLVEASRAGKTHLLEHAFDVMLEAGEIPPSSFFVEIICRAMIQDDFDRAITVLNSMAHAPFQVREKEWRGLFEEYKGKITRSHLRKLLDKIGVHDVAMEASAYKLSRLLQSLCGSKSHNANENVSDLESSSSSSSSGDVKLHSIMERYADELESVDEGAKSGDYDDYDSEDDLLSGELGRVDESKRSKLPSADGILENWKESMMKDGIFLPFQSSIK
ncbi:hypothetical protein OSB04_002787 [Centaurea solstitialis]|uniref:Pentatricopeptide repeat-containing protein n=1 Tax=Centaurea solstitialis TaxID=347529 RepID=A0AA38U660_9ASTR|nr:hypothetical protein OSB04_002787 [Centaurea solstitialis]